MIRRLLAVGLIVAGALCFTLPGRADAVEVVAAAWWSRATTTDPLDESPQPLPVPAPTTPQTVPLGVATDGQLVVEGTPEGATAVAALTFSLREDESSPSLTLPIGPGSTVSPESIILACRAGAPWTPPETSPGRWEAKPIADGRACINGMVADDLSTVTFGLQPLVRKGMLDIVLVPGLQFDLPVNANGSAFHWAFDIPTVDALAVVEGSDFREGADPVIVTVPTTVASSSSGVSSRPPSTARPSMAAPVLGPVSSPASSYPTGDTSLVAAPALGNDDLLEPIAAFGAQPPVGLEDEGGDARTVGVALLLAGLAAAAWSYLTPRAGDGMVGLGRFRRPLDGVAAATGGVDAAAPAPSSAVSGGLGRFARVRQEPPVPIQ